ncbi:MAG: response regulator [Spirulinaceae cyanobacterium]
MAISQTVRHILIVEDNLAHIRLIQEAFKLHQQAYDLAIARDGVEAITYLQQMDVSAPTNRPDLILLDLNLPRKNGHQVLAEVKEDPQLRCIPIVVLSTSNYAADIQQSYDLHANCYIRKSRNFQELSHLIQQIEDFWFNTVTLQPK